MNPDKPRKLYCVLSARSLPYARHAFASLSDHCVEPLDVTIITDTLDDRLQIEAAVSDLRRGASALATRSWRVMEGEEVEQRAARFYSHHPVLAQFRLGHPCWRKITDPPLFAAPGEEMIILDPDLYFPNEFAFEPTASSGIALMWQRPHCLLPRQCVEAAIRAGYRLAHHTDIGVAQLRNDLDLDWLSRLVETLGGKDLPRQMHVESIVWAAMAMRDGGSYLDPSHWHCWEYAHWKRLALRLGVHGERLLAVEPFATIKCFHGGGKAKWWLAPHLELYGAGVQRSVIGPGRRLPFVELTARTYYERERLKDFAGSLGYQRLFGSHH